MSVVAVLPMKAASQRVPGKNLRHMAGRPLFRWVLDTLLAVPAVDRVVIDVDEPDVFAHHGLVSGDRVHVRRRPLGLHGHATSMNDILAAVVQDVPASTYLMTHATNPLLRPSTLERALAVPLGEDHDSVFGVTRVQTRFWRDDATPVNHDPDDLVQTQDLEPWFEENSCLYAFTAASFAATGARIGACPRLLEIPRDEAVDIDTEDDWRMAEDLLLARLAREHTRGPRPVTKRVLP